MDKVFKIMIGAMFVIIVIGCLGMLYAQPTPTFNDNCTYNLIKEKISDYNNGDSLDVSNKQSNSTTVASSSKYKGFDSNDPNIEIIEKEYIRGDRDLPFYKVTYRDGEFRQFDAKSGELIGSSYQSDQEKFGIYNGQLE